MESTTAHLWNYYKISRDIQVHTLSLDDQASNAPPDYIIIYEEHL